VIIWGALSRPLQIVQQRLLILNSLKLSQSELLFLSPGLKAGMGSLLRLIASRLWQRIENRGMDHSQSGAVIQDIKSLALSFQSISFKHVYRGQNVAAHILARSSEFGSVSVWRGVPPMCIRETICTDGMFS
jgi:hypothetical protein